MKEFTEYDCPFEYIEDCIKNSESFTSHELDYISIDVFNEELKEELNLLVEYKYLRKTAYGDRIKYSPQKNKKDERTFRSKWYRESILCE